MYKYFYSDSNKNYLYFIDDNGNLRSHLFNLTRSCSDILVKEYARGNHPRVRPLTLKYLIEFYERDYIDPYDFNRYSRDFLKHLTEERNNNNGISSKELNTNI